MQLNGNQTQPTIVANPIRLWQYPYR